MAGLSLDHPWAFTFGILGNVISFMVYLSPLPTFYRVYRKKSTEGFQSVPYVVALFSAMLWIYYASVKTNAPLLITINSIGCFIETVYIAMYLTYAPNKAKMLTAKMLLLLNVGVFGAIVLLTLLLFQGPRRVTVLGWLCVGFSMAVFVAPLSVIKLVIRTKSVEFMPFSLSFSLTSSAIVWFAYGLLTKDIYVTLPNILGFVFGVLQMVLYIAYKDANKGVQDHKLPEHKVAEHVIAIAKPSTGERSSEVHPLDARITKDSCEEARTAGKGDHREGRDRTDGGDEKSVGAKVEIEMHA